MREKFVITGATGFVGSNLIKYFLKKNKDLYLIVRPNSNMMLLENYLEDLNIFRYDSDINKLISFFKETKPDCVFHLASIFIAEHNSSQIDSLLESNVSFGLHILEAMKEAGVKKIVNTGTSWQHYNNEKYNPVCLYAATKQAFESLLEYYTNAEGFTAITLKLFDTYGETDTRPKLINLLNKFSDDQLELNMSPGEQMLNLVHIYDVCKAFDVAHNLFKNEKRAFHLKYAVANTKNYKLKDVIKTFELVTNKKINVVWGGKSYRKREVMKLWNKGEILPNWKAEITLEEGLNAYQQ